MWGTAMGVIKGDTRCIDKGSYNHWTWDPFGECIKCYTKLPQGHLNSTFMVTWYCSNNTAEIQSRTGCNLNLALPGSPASE